MKVYDEAAQAQIDFLEYQLDAADIELAEVRKELEAALGQIQRMISDRECVD